MPLDYQIFCYKAKFSIFKPFNKFARLKSNKDSSEAPAIIPINFESDV